MINITDNTSDIVACYLLTTGDYSLANKSD